MNAAIISQHIIVAFSSLQQKFHKGRSKHIKEIQVFQKYFETVYDPNDLSRTIHEATVTLKEKMQAKVPSLKIPEYMEDKYKFALNYYPTKFPPLPTSKMHLAFVPLFPWWFICGEFLKVRKYECLKPTQRVALSKLDLYSFKGHLHVDIDHVKVETLIHKGEESK